MTKNEQQMYNDISKIAKALETQTKQNAKMIKWIIEYEK